MAKRSRTAQYVALTRAVLTEKQVLDDPYAAGMLTRPMRAVRVAMRLPPLRQRTDSPFFAALATRIAFFDGHVAAALDEGIDQVVIIGAGYDSRAWRFARPGTRFFEVDHPATQNHKRHRAPAGGGPKYVPLDLEANPLNEALVAGGFEWGRPALFVIEGVTMYLDGDSVRALLGQLADLAAPGSRLAVNFAAPPGTGTASDQWRQRALRLLGAASGERHRFFLTASEAGPFVAQTGWVLEEAGPLRERAPTLLGPTSMKIDGINPEGAVVAGRR